ncbi:IS66 family transposase [Candidatus Cardinium sp. TP]|uniref:IS66 family transposase n=1 Tax=Candidatus Cardinium sp. TP TaxID=2961955 RepID=UPI0021AED705|nr:IS66 family transposase [Candidatus Cardinium sp. TP]MCT4697302.1 IS66 family transposase [Candidatus Cardinium sp. TP]MDN5247252.1 IS66 family transposase [Candidatus Cardinium sp.]
MDDLTSVISSLEARISLLEAEISLLRGNNRLLKATNTSLREENAKLKDKLGLTSKELYKQKRDKVKSPRNRGGQTGHSGTTRTKLAADEVIDLPISDSCSCGGSVVIFPKPYIHQKIDLPEIKPHVTNYHVYHGRCRQCGKRYAHSLPTGVTSDTFSPNIKSVITALTGFYKNSKREVSQILQDIFNLDISLGSISNSEARVASKCQKAYQAIEETVKNSKMLHIDETGHYTSGKLGWCWIFTTPIASLLKLTDSRSRKVLESSGLNPTRHLVISDIYPVYNYFPPTHRQLCWSHLARDFERYAHSWHSDVKRLGVYLKEIASELFALHRAFLNQSIELFNFLRRIRKLRQRTWYALKAIIRLPDAIHASPVARNIMRVEPMLWRFYQDPINIPLTNNLAERQIRHYVVYRKNSYFTQSERGNRFLERIISLYLTWKQKKLKPY